MAIQQFIDQHHGHSDPTFPCLKHAHQQISIPRSQQKIRIQRHGTWAVVPDFPHGQQLLPIPEIYSRNGPQHGFLSHGVNAELPDRMLYCKPMLHLEI